MNCKNIYYIILLLLLSLIFIYFLTSSKICVKKTRKRKHKNKTNFSKQDSVEKGSVEQPVQEPFDPNATLNDKRFETGKAASKNIFLQSDLVENARQVNLVSNLIPNISDTKLLYKSTSEKLNINELYSNITDKGRTVILFSVEDLSTVGGSDNVIGIYTDKGWLNLPYKYLDKNAMLFDITKSTFYSIPTYGVEENVANISKFGLGFNQTDGPSLGTEFSISNYQGSYYVKTEAKSLINKNARIDGPFGKLKKQKKITNVEAWQIISGDIKDNKDITSTTITSPPTTAPPTTAPPTTAPPTTKPPTTKPPTTKPPTTAPPTTAPPTTVPPTTAPPTTAPPTTVPPTTKAPTTAPPTTKPPTTSPPTTVPPTTKPPTTAPPTKPPTTSPPTTVPPTTKPPTTKPPTTVPPTTVPASSKPVFSSFISFFKW